MTASMSEPPDPIPLAAIPVDPPTAQPQYAPPPLPLQPLSYGMSHHTGRPWILTSVGVFSIIVAGISILMCLFTGLTSFGVLMAASVRMPRPVASTPAPGQSMPMRPAVRASPMGLVDPTLTVGGRGLEVGPRRIVMQGLLRARSLSPARQQMLDAFLADSGMDLFPFDPSSGSVTIQTVTNNVSETGRLPAAGAGAGPDFFALANGRLEVYDDHALFSPSDGRETIRLSKDDIASSSGLSANDIEAIIARAQQQTQNALTSQQTAAIRTLLAAPGQTYVPTSALRGRYAVSPAQQTYATVRSSDGAATLIFPTGQVVIATDGRIISTFSASFAGGGPVFTVSKPAATVVIIESLLSFLLAIYLLVIGILVLRQNSRGRLLHNIYAAVKLPLAIVATIATYQFWATFRANSTTGMAGASLLAAFVAFGAIYPIVLLFVMQSRTVRDYYTTAQPNLYYG
jgi:hypothetical protein